MTDNVPPRIQQLSSNIEEHFMSLVAPAIKKASLQLAEAIEDTRRTEKHLRFMDLYGSKPASFSAVLRKPEELEKLLADSDFARLEAMMQDIMKQHQAVGFKFKAGDRVRWTKFGQGTGTILKFCPEFYLPNLEKWYTIKNDDGKISKRKEENLTLIGETK